MRWIITALCMLLSFGAIAAKFDDFPYPKKTMVLAIGDKVEMNSVDLSMWKTNFAIPLDQVLEFYRIQWSDPVATGAPGYIENTLGEWKVISRIEGKQLFTIQVQPSGTKRSTGFAAVSNLPGVKQIKQLGKHFPKPSKTQVHNDIVTTDANVKSRTLVMTSDHPIQTVSRFYDSYYQQKGWTRQGQLTESVVYKKHNKEVSLALVSGYSNTHIVLVETKS